MKKTAIYPGTFDPITNGHLDLVKRAGVIFDEVIIAISKNPKKQPLFTIDERIALVEESMNGLPNVRVEGFDELLIDFVNRKNANFIIRGLRAISDFEFEFQLAAANRRMDDGIETIFLTPSESNYFTSSSLVREISYYQGDVSSFVPEPVLKALQQKWSETSKRK